VTAIARARTALRGADAVAARRHLEDAVGEGAGYVAEAALGNLLVAMGLPGEAEAHVERAVGGAVGAGDHGVACGEAIVLASLRLGRDDWDGAARAARALDTSARTRGNPLGVAAAALMDAACQGRTRGAAAEVARLFGAASELRDGGHAAALAVVKARLVELRSALGDAEFGRIVGACRT
jgi:hypothetical protein